MVSDRSYAATIATWVFVLGYASRPLLGSILPSVVMPGVYVVVILAALVAYRRVLAEAARRAWQHKTRSLAIVVGGYLGILALTVALGISPSIFSTISVLLPPNRKTPASCLSPGQAWFS